MTWVCQCDRELIERDGLLVCDLHGVRTQSHELRWVTLNDEKGAGP
jgi:hypothetical protein